MEGEAAGVLYQRPEGRAGNGRCGKDIGVRWAQAAHCIGFILQSSGIFCDSLTCHYSSRPQPLFLVNQTKLTSI